ncbi:RagB/SusD family nutrient uptake outer membrane protein [Chryseolinea sp. T2]|uniref:RagB/SusD family nutrient uptake outer membrane protein n=1 Tax=Chryseolinea sp. T2 TaxID=3129255 RepID=UPI0030769CF3
MKKIFRNKFIWSTMVMASAMYACSDSFLDVPPTGSLDQNLLNTSLGMDRALIAAYSQVNGRDNRMGSPSNWVWGSIRGGENNKGTDPGDFSDINPIQRFEYLSTQGVINDKYNANYELVARTNAILRFLLAPGADITPAQITSYSAQARFLRAHGYFELARGFNKTPYVDENIDLATGAGDVQNTTDLWPQIEADLKFAYDNLPETQAEVGRVNKWAAASYLAKVYMYQQKYADAKALFDVIIASGQTSNGKKYALVPVFSSVFKASNDNHSESVWAYQAAANTGSVNNANPEFDLNWPYNTGADGPGNCCSFFQPTQEMGNSYRTEGGLPLLDDGAGTYAPAYNTAANAILTDMGIESTKAWDATVDYKKDGYVTRNDPGKPWQERVYKANSDNKGADPASSASWKLVWVESTNAAFQDLKFDPRIDYTIGRRGIPYLDWQDFPGKAWIRNQPNAGPYQTKKYVYYKSDKGSLQDNSSWTPGYTAVNYTIIRFADILLMAAEAEIEVGSPAKARDYVNMIRLRASNPDGFVMSGTATAANYEIALYTDAWAKDDATREKVRFERKLELSGEGHRFYDLMRWSGVYGGAASDYGAKVINAYLSYETPLVPSGAFTGSTFDDKDKWLPLPQGQIDLKPGVLTQNPGY